MFLQRTPRTLPALEVEVGFVECGSESLSPLALWCRLICNTSLHQLVMCSLWRNEINTRLHITDFCETVTSKHGHDLSRLTKRGKINWYLPSFGAAVLKQRRRRDKRHCHEAS